MKTLLALLFLVLPALRAEPPAKPAVLLVVGAQMFRDATVRKLDAFTARITHANGTATLPAWEFSEAQQRSFGFDPAAVAAEVARREAVRQAAAEAERRARQDYLLGVEKKIQAREELARMEAAKMEEARLDAEALVAAKKKLDVLLDNEAARTKDGTLKRLHDLNRLIVREKNLRARDGGSALLMASPGDQLAAAGLTEYFQKKGRMSASEFSVLDPSTKRQILQFVPEMMPRTGQLGAWEDERDQIKSRLLVLLAEEERAKMSLPR